MKRSSAQSGSAFFLILIGIALFAALSYAFMKGGSGSQAMLTKDQARIAATEIISYAGAVQKGVQKLRLGGCSVAQISFDGIPVTGYANANEPADGSCKVFGINGAKVNYTPPSEVWLDTSHAAGDSYGDWYFTPSCLDGAGTTCDFSNDENKAEIIMVLPWLKKDVCEALNNILIKPRIDTMPGNDDDDIFNTSRKADGDYTSSNPQLIPVVGGTLLRQSSLCLYNTGGIPTNGYVFYQILIVQ